MNGQLQAGPSINAVIDFSLILDPTHLTFMNALNTYETLKSTDCAFCLYQVLEKKGKVIH